MHTDYTYRCMTSSGEEAVPSTLEEALHVAWIDHVDGLAEFLDITGPDLWLGPKWFAEWTSRLSWGHDPTDAQITKEASSLRR